MARLATDDLFVSHTLRDPQSPDSVRAGRWGQDVPSRPDPPRRPERVLGAQDNQKGHIFSVSIGGQVFAGFDHYHVASISDPFLGLGTRVTVWNDDPDDWPIGTRRAEVWDWYAPGPDRFYGQGSADALDLSLVASVASFSDDAKRAEKLAWLRAWVADPAHWPVNTRWRVTRYEEDPARLLKGGISADGVPFTMRPWSQFVPPPANEARHGIWVDEASHQAHAAKLREHQEAVGWRDYSDVTGAQRAQGRYLPSPNTITWYATTTNSAVGWQTADQEKALSRSVGSGTITVSVPANASNAAGLTLITPTDDPNQATWPSGDYRAQLDISSIGATVSIESGASWYRITADTNTQRVTNRATDTTDISTTGTHLLTAVTTNDWNGATPVAGDRYAIRVGTNNSDMMTASSVVFTCDADFFVDGPWTEGTTYNQSVSGTVTSSGALLKQARIVKAGTVTSAGALLKLTARAVTGAVASAGALLKQAQRVLTGTLDSAGVLTAVRLVFVVLTGTLTSAGSLTKQAQLVLAGTVASAGALVRQAQKVTAGTVASAGALVKHTARALTGTLDSSGALDAARTTLIVLTGTLTSAGTLTKQAGLVLAGSVTSAGALAKQAGKILAGAVTSAGELAAVRIILAVLTGTLGMAGALTKRATVSLTGALASAGTLVKQAQIVLVGAVSSSGALAAVRTVLVSLTGAVALAGTLTKSTAVSVSGAVSSSGALTKRAALALTGVLTSSGALVRQAQTNLAGTISASGALVKQTARSLTGSLSPVGALTRLTSKVLAGALSFVGTLVSLLGGQRPAETRLVATYAPTTALLGTAVTSTALIGTSAPSTTLLATSATQTDLLGTSDPTTTLIARFP